MNEQAEREMWDIINRANPGSDINSDKVARTTRTRRGERVVILTDDMVAATSHDGWITTTEGDSVVWYTLGKPFDHNGMQARYGYLHFNSAVASQRDRRRSQRDWDASMRAG